MEDIGRIAIVDRGFDLDPPTGVPLNGNLDVTVSIILNVGCIF